MGTFGNTFGGSLGVQNGTMLKLLIYNILITPITSFSNTISATVDTKGKAAVVTVEYGTTIAYGSAIPINEGIINGIVPVTATLTL